MKKFLKILGLLCITVMTVLSSHANTAVPYKIKGEFISIEPDVDGETITSESSTSKAPLHEPVDLSNATLTLSYEITNNKGEVETKVFYEGPYEEDFETFGALFEPFEIKISLRTTEDSDPMTINTVIGNGSDVHFAYIDRLGQPDQFLLAGATNQVMNPENKFSVKGDLGFLNNEATATTSVEVYAIFVDIEGNHQLKQWGPVLVRDNKFLIEGDVDRPLTAQFYVHGDYSTFTAIVLEPQNEFVVGKLGNQTLEVGITSDSGFHTALVESWQQDEEYIALIEEYATEYEQYLKRSNAGEPEPDTSEEEDSEATVREGSEVSQDIIEEVLPEEGCEDAVAQDGDDYYQASPSNPKYYSLHAKARDFRNEKLKQIAEGDDDPMTRYLAIEMRPYHWRDYASQLVALRPLAKELDDEFVAAFITPKIETYEKALIVVQNDDALIPGQKVPEFTLVNYDGEEVVLYELLAEKDLVLIDFWASWCGPCIADFPELKKLHAAFTDENFEIIGVSIDSTEEAWKGGVAEYELPWINFGEALGVESPVAMAYGIITIPKGFLVDSQGCIYKKNIRPAALKDFLVDRYGLDESLVEPDHEVEDASDVSG